MSGVNMEERRQSPCATCDRVSDPESCENKLCNEWQQWFIDRWDAMREYYRSARKITSFKVGGERYYHPEDVRRFLEEEGTDELERNREGQTQ